MNQSSDESSDLGTLAESIRKHALHQASEEWYKHYNELMHVLCECGLATLDRGHMIPVGDKFKVGKAEITSEQLIEALRGLFVEHRTNLLREKLTKRLLMEASLREQKEPPDILK